MAKNDILENKRLVNAIVSGHTKGESKQAVLKLLDELGFKDTKSNVRGVLIYQHETHGQVRVPNNNRLTRMDLHSVQTMLGAMKDTNDPIFNSVSKKGHRIE